MTEQKIEFILNKIIADEENHLRWLNTLSMLEFVGTRKIAGTMELFRMDETALKHLAEEARHALFFKRALKKIRPDVEMNSSRENLLCGFEANRYFQSLEGLVKKEYEADYNGKDAPLSAAHFSYLYVTLLIEERAGMVYEIYNACLEKSSVNISLKGLIGEEEQHLIDITNDLARLDTSSPARLPRLRLKEKEFFERFFGKVALKLEKTPAPV